MKSQLVTKWLVTSWLLECGYEWTFWVRVDLVTSLSGYELTRNHTLPASIHLMYIWFSYRMWNSVHHWDWTKGTRTSDSAWLEWWSLWYYVGRKQWKCFDHRGWRWTCCCVGYKSEEGKFIIKTNTYICFP